MSRAAAFFDLDKTLMAGSSGMPFARVATRHGIVSRRQLASWGVEHLRYRLRGTTDERTTEVLRQARDLISGVPARDLERMNPEVMAAILPRIYPQMLDEVHAHQDAGRATFIVSAAGNGVVEPLAAVLGIDGGIGTRYEVDAEGAFTGRFDGPFVYGPGKVEAMRGLRRRARDRPRRLLRLLRLALGPADARSRRPPGGRQPGPGAGRDRQARGLAGDALRAPRPPPCRRRGHRCWRPSPASAAPGSPPAARPPPRRFAARR